MQSLELIFENLETGMYKYHPSSLTFRTERTCTPGTLTGDIPDVTGHVPQMGDTVRLRVDNTNVFYGRIFSTSINRWGVLSFTAYDQMRYLKNTYSMCYRGDYTTKQVITDIAKLYGLKLGKIEDIPKIGYKLSIDNESCFDVISKLVDTACVLTKRILVFYDNLGELELRYADDMISDVLIGDSSLATEYQLTTDIDNDTYNQVSLYRESSSAGDRAYASAQDKNTTNKWGTLRLIEAADDILTFDQMLDRAQKTLEMKNRPFKTMTISALGVVGLRAGMMITIHFPSLDDSVSKRQMVILDSVEHHFEDSVHTMELETRTFWRDS